MITAFEAAYAGQQPPNDLTQKTLVAESDQPTQPLELTARKRDVQCYLAQGLSNQELADTLAISLYTVRSHAHNILGKLNLANRTQATLYTRDVGLDTDHWQILMKDAIDFPLDQLCLLRETFHFI